MYRMYGMQRAQGCAGAAVSGWHVYRGYRDDRGVMHVQDERYAYRTR